MTNKILFLQYPKCGTCQKATKWLKENSVDVDSRHIVEDRPRKEELKLWIEKSKLPIAKFFNTSGKIYKDQNLKEVVKTASTDELLDILASNGMVVKRPIIVTNDKVLVGFKEEEWTKVLK